jgi:hypothetical protein
VPRIAAFAFQLWLLANTSQWVWADTNIAPYATIRSTPYVGAAIAYLVDGKVGTDDDNTLMMAAPLPIRIGQVMPIEYEFVFPHKSSVTRVRLFQHETRGRRPASGYVIDLDTEGDRRYGKVVVTERNGSGGRWAEYQLSPPVAAYGLRFRTTAFPAGAGPNYGSPVVGEFEIYADMDTAPFAIDRPSVPDAPYLTEDAREGRSLKVETAGPWRMQFQRGLVGSMWLFWSAGKAYSEQANARNVELLKKLKVNRYWLNPGVYVPSHRDLSFLTLPKDPRYLYFIDRQFAYREHSGVKEMKMLPFPSTVVPGYKENVLQQFAAQMHKNNIGVIVNQSPLPYGLGSWDFPRVMNPREYPCILSSSFVRDASTMLYREFMNAGIDGLALGGDEFFVHSHTGRNEDSSPVCRNANGSPNGLCDPTCNELFSEKFGINRETSGTAFSSSAAKWKVFEYERLGTLFANYAQMMRSVNPNAVVTSLFRAGEENRPAYGIAYDVMGSTGMVAEMSSNPYWSNNSYLGHYYFANETKKLMGASREGTAVITLQPTPNFDKNGYRDPIMLYGPALSAVMHGAQGINFYEQNYLFAGGKNDAGPLVEKIFNLTAWLEQKRLVDYHVPKAVALVYSRASDDWWQLAHSASGVEAAEAILYQNAVMEVLFRNGIPFDLCYLDQPSSLDVLSRYTMALLPYPYSIGREAVNKIRQAIGKGTRVVALQRSGEVDEFGERYPSPLLQGVRGIEHLAIDLTGSNYSELSAHLIPVIMKNLNGRLPLRLNAGGKDVECSILESKDSRLVFCLNWEKQPVEINLGISLPQGTYAASVITLERETPGSIDGKSSLSVSDFRGFRLALGPEEAKIVSITAHPAGASLN